MSETTCTVSQCNFDIYQDDECIFHCCKDENSWWYTVVEKEIKLWNRNKVKEFWIEIREKKMSQKDYNFLGYIFPEFENTETVGIENEKNETKKYKSRENFNFWKVGETMEFNENVNFSNTSFSGETSFSEVKFKLKTYFKDSKFFEKALFQKSIFSSKASFSMALFFKKADFKESIFFGDTIFLKLYFIKTLFFYELDFLLKAKHYSII